MAEAGTAADQAGIPGLSALHDDAIAMLGRRHVHADPTTNLLHSYDASLERGTPDLVVTPGDIGELRALIAAAYRHGVPFVMRGAGTGYSGGALPAHGGMVVSTARLDRILETDFEEGWIRCEPGVVLATVQRLAESAGWRYLPDPSSHQVCTIGGNVAENAGGPHALGGGPTSNYVRAIDLIRPDGSIVTLDDQQVWDGELDLRSLVVGSEGTLGAVATITLRLLRTPETSRVVLATFADQGQALDVVSATFDIGLLPSAMDMLTGGFIPTRPDFHDPTLLFVGLQGRAEEVAHQVEQIDSLARRHGGDCDVLEVPQFLDRRADLVRAKVRRMVEAGGSPRYYLFDAVAPRSNLRSLMAAIRDAAEEYGFPVLNTFHAGDGNVHPTPFYDPADPHHKARLQDFSTQILRECRRMHGTLSGEHGVGLEKRALMQEFFGPDVLAIMRRIKRVFDPPDLCNPGTMLPGAPTAREPGGPAREPAGRSARLSVSRVDAFIEISDPDVAFVEVEEALVGSPYELPYEPLAATPMFPVLKALDAGLPGLRSAAHPRDLVLSATLRRSSAVIDLGSRCTKDVSGYELRKLVYGGRGRLGAPAAARLRLLPRTSDSRLAQSMPMAVDEAIALCRRVHAADLPFGHLGVVLTRDGGATVAGRLELRGGGLERHIAALRLLDVRVMWKVVGGDRWTDPPMAVLSDGAGALEGTAGMPWNNNELLGRLARRRTAAYASVSHGRTWWRLTSGGEAPSSPLTVATAAAFGAV